MRSAFLWVLMVSGTVWSAEPILHRFVATDESRGQVLLVDQRDPARDWTVPLAKNRDVFVDGDTVVVSTPTGLKELALQDGRTLREVTVGTGVASVTRAATGRTFLANGSTIWEVDQGGAVISTLPIQAGGCSVCCA